jgi:serine/threonine protein kinase
MRRGTRPPEANLEPGDRLGGYRLQEVLGEGAMGVVYRAVDTTTGDTVALKVLRPGVSVDETLRRRFAHEARAASEVQHPSLVGVIRVGQDRGMDFLATEYIEGPSLEQRLKDHGPMFPIDAVPIVADVAAGLDALHGRGLVHRDIKPSNILLGRDGRARLADFGLAKGPGYTVLTSVGRSVGTPDYMAPEMITGASVTGACDIYGLGCVVFKTITGGPVFDYDSILQVLQAHMSEEPPDPCKVRPGIQHSVCLVVLRALAKQPGDRQAAAGEFALGLELGAAKFLE